MTAHNISFQAMSGRDIDMIALGLIRRYQPNILKNGKSFDVHRFFDTKLEDLTQVTPVYSNELPYEIHGMTDSANKQVIIQEDLANDVFSEKFFRSTLAHESGHCIMHVPQLQRINRNQVFKQAKNEDGIKLYRKEENIPLYCNPEWQAWRFAGALLMPETSLRMMLKDNAGLSEMADNFDVNISFLKARLKALKIQN